MNVALQTIRVFAQLYLMHQIALFLCGHGKRTLGMLLIEAPLLLIILICLTVLTYGVTGDNRHWFGRHDLLLHVVWVSAFGLWFWGYSESPFILHESLGAFGTASRQAAAAYYLRSGGLFLLCLASTSGLSYVLRRRTPGAFITEGIAGDRWWLLFSVGMWALGVSIWLFGVHASADAPTVERIASHFTQLELMIAVALGICAWLITRRTRVAFWAGMVEVLASPLIIGALLVLPPGSL